MATSTFYVSEGDEHNYVTPTVDVKAGAPYEISTGYWGVPSIDVETGDEQPFRVSGVFRGLKANAADSFAIGALVTWNGSGFTADVNGTWRVVKVSPSGAPNVEVQINVSTDTGVGGGSTTLFSSVTSKADLLTQVSLVVGHVSKVNNSLFSYRLVSLPSTSAANWQLTTHVQRLTTAEFGAIATNYTDLDEGMIVDDIDEGKRFRYSETANASAPLQGWIEIGGFGGGGAGAGGSTNLSYLASPTGGTVVSDTGTDATLPITNATNAGYRRPTGTVTVPTGTAIALSNSTSYEILTGDEFNEITGMDATWDGQVIDIYVGPNASLVTSAGTNIRLDGSRGDIITPTFAAVVQLKYRHSDTEWIELSRSKF